MDQLFIGTSLFLLVTLLGGLTRIVRGPTRADRMLAAQLFGSATVAILLLIAEGSGLDGVRDVALVLALLSTVSVVAFARASWKGKS